MTPETIQEFGIVAFLLMLVWKALQLVEGFLRRDRPQRESSRPEEVGSDGAMDISVLACRADPKHFERIRAIDARTKDMHKYTETVQKQVSSGQFACAWNGRDEVRDLLEELKSLRIAVNANTSAINGGK